jgi:3-phosphoshikimate 1-carboxyvinyltransferase
MLKLKAPHRNIKTCVALPGSKSISNRLLLIREINRLSIHYKNLSEAEDTVLLAQALGEIRNKKKGSINIHHAGTDMRFLTAYLSTKAGEWTLTGSQRMKERPIAELVNVLRSMGAEIVYKEKDGFPPLSVKGQKLAGGKIQMDGSISSQYASALLLAASQFQNDLELELTGDIVSRPYLTMTIELLQSFGAVIETKGNSINYKISELHTPNSELKVESDWSAASYWYSIAALSENSDIELKYLSKKSLQPDSVLPSIYERLGVKTEFTESGIRLSKQRTELKDFEFDFVDCPDIAQTIAVTCLGLGIPAKLKGLQTLKHKETDRIQALKNELEKFGATVEATQNSLMITRDPSATHFRTLNPAPIAIGVTTYNDHRMALSFAPLALLCNSVKIDDEEVVNKSYPGFWDDLGNAGFELD